MVQLPYHLDPQKCAQAPNGQVGLQREEIRKVVRHPPGECETREPAVDQGSPPEEIRRRKSIELEQRSPGVKVVQQPGIDAAFVVTVFPVFAQFYAVADALFSQRNDLEPRIFALAPVTLFPHVRELRPAQVRHHFRVVKKLRVPVPELETGRALEVFQLRFRKPQNPSAGAAVQAVHHIYSIPPGFRRGRGGCVQVP
jgi:hypothetical protein